MNIFDKFFKSKKNISEQSSQIKHGINSTKLTFNDIDSEFFPYACHLNKNTVLTKNGHIFQIIKIDISDFKLNQESGLRAEIRKILNESTTDLKTSFWIHTVKKKNRTLYKKHINFNENLSKENNIYDNEDKVAFLNQINSEYTIKENQLNSYSTIVYISIFRQGINFKLTPINIIKQVFKFLMIKFHDIHIENQIKILDNITKNLISELTKYRPLLLSIIARNDKYYSEIIELLFYLTNFQEEQCEISEIDITKIINKNSYIFTNGISIMKDKENHDISLFSVFSLKEVPIVPINVISDIISTHAEFIICEYVSFIDKKTANNQYSEQIGLLKNVKNKDFIENAGLQFLLNNNNFYCKSSISLITFSNNIQELQKFIKDINDVFSKYGIIIIKEDISIQKTYGAFLPGNFYFTHRMLIHDAKEIGSFVYSYTPQEQDESVFLNSKALFKIGTLKNNPFYFGLDKYNKNIIVSGQSLIGKTTFCNFLLSKILTSFNPKPNMFIIEFNNKSKTFTQAIGGKWFQVSLKKQNNTARFNPLALKFFNKSDENIRNNYLIEFFSSLLSVANVIIDTKIMSEMNLIINTITAQLDKIDNVEFKQFALHDIRNIFTNTRIDNEIQSWHSIGKYYHLFDNREDVFNALNCGCFYIDHTITDNDNILALTMNHIITNIIYRSKNNIKYNNDGSIVESETKKTIVLIEEPFIAFHNSLFKSKFEKMIENAAKNNVIIISKITDLEKESSTIVDFSSLIRSSGTQIHFANKYADENYGRIFKLKKFEYLAIKSLIDYTHGILIKQGENVTSCRFDMTEFKKTLQILSDNDEIRTKIMTVKEILQTDDPDRWIQMFYDDYGISKSVNAKEMIEKELQILESVRQILE